MDVTMVGQVRSFNRVTMQRIGAFNDEPYADHWFEKTLDPPGPGT